MKRLIVFSGPPCSGKTTLGEMVAERLNIPHLEMDAIRRRLLPDASHTPETRQVAYRGMQMVAEVYLRVGGEVILNACYGHEENRRQVERIARECGATLIWIECHVTAETAIARAAQRRDVHPGKDLTPERVRRLVEQYPFTGSGIIIDSERDVGECLELLLRYLAGNQFKTAVAE